MSNNDQIYKLDPASITRGTWRAVGVPVKAVTAVLDQNFDEVARQIFVGTGGDLSVQFFDDIPGSDGYTVLYKNLPDAYVKQGLFTRINSEGTTASDLVWET